MLPHQLSVPLDSFSKGVLASTGASLPAQPSGWATVHRACGSCRTQRFGRTAIFSQSSQTWGQKWDWPQVAYMALLT